MKGLSRYINKLEKKQNAQREIEYYNLDIIISVGYRVNSIRGTVFRKWANKILKEYMYKGFVIDQQKLISNDTNYRSFASTVKLISDLVDRKQLMIGESTGLLKIISKYAYALDTLDKYDHQTLTITNITKDDKQIKLEYDDATFKLFPSKVTKGFFGSQRFDRVDGKKQHVISLAAILETTHRISNLDYKHLFQVIQKISVDKEDYYEAFRRMTFNVLYGNKDDHGKKPGFYI